MGRSKKTSEPDDGEPDVETLQLTQTLLRRTFRERFSRGEHRQEQERLMDIDPLLVTHTQSTKLVQPSESSLYLRLASIGMMWRARRPSGRWRGRLRSPCNGGMESTSDRACCESTVAVAFRHSVVGNEWRSGCLLIKRRHAHTLHALASFRPVKSTAGNHARKRDQTR